MKYHINIIFTYLNCVWQHYDNHAWHNFDICFIFISFEFILSSILFQIHLDIGFTLNVDLSEDWVKCDEIWHEFDWVDGRPDHPGVDEAEPFAEFSWTEHTRRPSGQSGQIPVPAHWEAGTALATHLLSIFYHPFILCFILCLLIVYILFIICFDYVLYTFCGCFVWLWCFYFYLCFWYFSGLRFFYCNDFYAMIDDAVMILWWYYDYTMTVWQISDHVIIMI